MAKFSFLIDENGNVSFSKNSPPQDSGESTYEKAVNILGDFFKSERIKHGFSKTDVAKRLGYKNVSKSVKNISLIEDSSAFIPDYYEKLMEIYDISQKQLDEILEKHKQEVEKQKREREIALRKKREEKTSFYRELIEALPFLMEHYDEIMNTPRYYLSPAMDSFIDSAFVKRKRSTLVIGELLELWANGKWKVKCPTCGSVVYITNAGGSPLSGRGSACGYCSGCKEMVYGIKPFNKFFKELMNLSVKKPPEKLSPVSLKAVLYELKGISLN